MRYDDDDTGIHSLISKLKRKLHQETKNKVQNQDEPEDSNILNATYDTQQQVARYLQVLGQVTGSGNLHLDNGVCALYDGDEEAVIIEAPKKSDNIILHCLTIRLPGYTQVDIYRELLMLNFEVSVMRGCWLALNEGDLRLCYTQEIKLLDEQSFTNMILGFMDQVTYIKQLVSEVNKAAS